MKWLWISSVGMVLVAAGIVWWPTLYRYDEMRVGSTSMPVRISRLNGSTEYLKGDVWKAVEVESPQPRSVRIPVEMLGQITGNASLDAMGFSGQLYNGSDWTITSVHFRVRRKDTDGSVMWDRVYTEDVVVKPLSASSFHAAVAGGHHASDFAWSVQDAFGYKDKSTSSRAQVAVERRLLREALEDVMMELEREEEAKRDSS